MANKRCKKNMKEYSDIELYVPQLKNEFLLFEIDIKDYKYMFTEKV